MQIEAFLTWKQPNKTDFLRSPLLFRPAQIILDRKIDLYYRIEVEDEDRFVVNPVLIHALKQHYDIEVESTTEDIQAFCSNLTRQLETNQSTISMSDDFSEELSWSVTIRRCIGNFNYKKSLLGSDYDKIINGQSENVGSLIGSHRKSANSSKAIRPILPLDDSQLDAIEMAEENDLVIQGPPGTGKSHTIVSLIGSYLSQGKSVLFVSQKRSALQVVYERLEDIGLSHLVAYFNTSKEEKKEFFKQLRETYEALKQPKSFENLSEPFLDTPVLDFYLNSYAKKQDDLETSYSELVKSMIDSGYKKKELEQFSSIPKLKEWQQVLEHLRKTEDLAKGHFNAKSISTASFSFLNRSVWSESDAIDKLESRLTEMRSGLETFKEHISELDPELNLKSFTQICLAASILSMVNRTQLDILNQDSKKFKSFSNWAKKYELLKSKVDRAEQGSSNWKNKPNKSEITELIDLIKHHHAPKGILGILKRRNERIDEAFEGFSKDLSEVGKLQLLEELRTEWNLKSELDEIKLKLKHNFNIQNPEHEVNHILQIRNKLEDVSQSAYLTLLENENPDELIEKLSGLHPAIQRFSSQAAFVFYSGTPQSIDEGLRLIQSIQKDINTLKEVGPSLQAYFMIPARIRDFVQQHAESIDKLDAAVRYNALVEHSRFEPQYKALNSETLISDLDKCVSFGYESAISEIERIRRAYHLKVLEVEKLLNTPASKLKEDQKSQKKGFKQAKRLIVHESGKKQRHMGLKEFSDQSWDYLKILQPVWMMNPLSVSERLHCIKDQFDVVIFDEASQIPLEDAIPSVFRAAQTVVVGDDKQMPPGNFFSASTEGNTLLDEANINFQQKMLKWHYRSQHPALIQFSNLHFYDNELHCLPPTEQSVPFEWIKVDGKFENGSNLTEAIEIAKITKGLNKAELENTAIISFSKEQENTIRKQLDKAGVKMEDLLIRNLENVQGIERDHIIISLGYGPKSNGEFSMNFGPVNQESGENRLNVLFTRAKRKITLITSVEPEDFKLSENTGVNHLKDYVRFVSSQTQLQQDHVQVRTYGRSSGCAFESKVDHQRQSVLLEDPSLNGDNTVDLIATYRALKNQFKKVEIVLSKDKWEHPEYAAKLLNQFH